MHFNVRKVFEKIRAMFGELFKWHSYDSHPHNIETTSERVATENKHKPWKVIGFLTSSSSEDRCHPCLFWKISEFCSKVRQCSTRTSNDPRVLVALFCSWNSVKCLQVSEMQPNMIKKTYTIPGTSTCFLPSPKMSG